MSLLISKNGLLDTVQDLGRYGWQHLGINPGGAMDMVAMQVANALVGNKMEEPVIEMYFPAAEIRFEETMLIALAGADLFPSINGNAVSILQPIMVTKDAVLRFGKQQKGACCYFAVQGGMIMDQWLNSSSTDRKVKAGGYQGRPLQKNDRLLLKANAYAQLKTDHPYKPLPWKANVRDLYRAGNFRFIAGAEYDLLTDTSKQDLESASFTVSRKSDRMGYRLQGKHLETVSAKEMISTAVTRGTIQLLPDGQLIILMADHQSTGGYPRLGHIISADISSLAQLRPGKKFSLQQTKMGEAENALVQQKMMLQQIKHACEMKTFK